MIPETQYMGKPAHRGNSSQPPNSRLWLTLLKKYFFPGTKEYDSRVPPRTQENVEPAPSLILLLRQKSHTAGLDDFFNTLGYKQ